MNNKKFTTYSVLLAASMLTNPFVADALAQDLDLQLGGKRNLPSIEVNIGEVYKAKNRAGEVIARRQAQESVVETTEVEEIRTIPAQQPTQETVEPPQTVNQIAQEIIRKKALDDNGTSELEPSASINAAPIAAVDAEKEERARKEAVRKKAAYENVQQLKKDIKKNKEIAARKKREAEELAKKQAEEAAAAAELAAREAEEAARREAEIAAQQAATATTTAANTNAAGTGQLDTSATAGTQQQRDITSPTASQAEPKLSDVPKLDPSRITITDTEDNQLEAEQNKAALEPQKTDPNEIPDAVVSAIVEKEDVLDENTGSVKKVEKAMPKSVPASMKKDAPADSVPQSIANKMAADKAPIEPQMDQISSQPTEVEEKSVVAAQPVMQGDKMVINIPKPATSDALSIASMFDVKSEKAPMPDAMKKISGAAEDTSSTAAVENSEDGSLLPPQSIIPSALNNKVSAAGTSAVAKANTEVASIPQSTPTVTGSVLMSVGFEVDSAVLAPEATDALENVVLQMKNDPSKRLSVIGYASNPDDTISTARRISLKRALAVRKHMIDQGIESTRINVQAMGNDYKGEGDKDKVDIFFAEDQAS